MYKTGESRTKTE